MNPNTPNRRISDLNAKINRCVNAVLVFFFASLYSFHILLLHAIRFSNKRHQQKYAIAFNGLRNVSKNIVNATRNTVHCLNKHLAKHANNRVLKRLYCKNVSLKIKQKKRRKKPIKSNQKVQHYREIYKVASMW